MSDKSTIWSEIKKLVVVFPYRSEENYKEYRSALDKLLNKSNVKEVKLIVVIPETLNKETLRPHVLIHFLSPKDMNFLGKIKDKYLKTILSEKYDALLWLEVEEKKIAKILSPLRVQRKIGVNTSFDFFSIQVNSNSNNPSEIVNFAQNILEKIS
jgi:hypothetical protein